MPWAVKNGNDEQTCTLLEELDTSCFSQVSDDITTELDEHWVAEPDGSVLVRFSFKL